MAKGSAAAAAVVTVPVTIAGLQQQEEHLARRYETAGGTLLDLEPPLWRVRLLTDGHLRAQADIPQPSPEELYEAMATRGALERQYAEQRVVVIRARRDLDAAVAARRQAQADDLAPRKAAAVERLDRALSAARTEVDALARIEDEQVSIVGNSTERLSATWSCVASDTPTFESTLTAWRRAVKSYGYDIGSTG